MEPAHLLHPALTDSLGGNARRLKSIHRFVPAAQLTVHLATTTYVRRTGRITIGMRSGWTTLRDPVLSCPTSAPTLPEWLCQEQRGFGSTTSAPVSDASTPVCTNGVWPPLRPVSVGRRTNRRPCCPPMSNPSTSSWTAWTDGSGRWDNWMAAQHMPRDLVRPSRIWTRWKDEEKGVAYYALVDFNVSTDTSVHNWILFFWFLFMCSSALNWFLTYTLVVPLTLNLPATSQFGCYWKYHTVVAIAVSI